MIKYNKSMINCINNIEESCKDFTENIMRIWPEFVEMKGFILLKKNNGTLKEINEDKILSIYYDRTGYEASYNEFRIEDYFEWCIKNPMEGLALALKISEIWEYKLKKEFPEYKFCIIIGFDGKFTTIRFHKLRDDEAGWIELDNLDKFENQSVSVRIVE